MFGIFYETKWSVGTSLVVQWLGLHAFTAKHEGSIPGRGIRILQAAQRSQKKKGLLIWSVLKMCFHNYICMKLGVWKRSECN